MIERKTRVLHPTGFSLETAGEVLRESMKYESRISFLYGDGEYNMKSLLSILGSGVRSRDEIVIRCDGADESEAMEAVAGLLENVTGESDG